MSKQQRGLGRGFDALIPTELEVGQGPIAAGAVSHDAVRQIDPAKIAPNPHQPRTEFNDEELKGLADSIKQHGLLQPVVATDKGGGSYELIAGERRLRASKLAGLSSIPVIVRDYDEQQKMELGLLENLQRVDLNPIETAQAYHKLSTEFNLSLDQIGERMGKAKSTISNVMRLLNLPQPMRQAIATGTLSEAHGRALLSMKDEAKRQKLFTAIVDDKLTVRQAEEMARSLNQGNIPARPSKPGTSAPATDSHVVRELGEYLGTKVTQQPTAKGGRLVIEYYSDEELERIFETIKRP